MPNILDERDDTRWTNPADVPVQVLEDQWTDKAEAISRFLDEVRKHLPAFVFIAESPGDRVFMTGMGLRNARHEMRGD